MTSTDQEKFSCRIAIEALRSGVPNGKAVEILGGNQPDTESQFQRLLDMENGSVDPFQDSRSMLISGDFGTGKSHMLEYCKHLALSQNYVCSMFSVSKETPFYNLDKIFKSAVDNGVIPGIVGLMVDEVTHKLDPNSDGYKKFFSWVHSSAGDFELHKIFAATLMVHRRTNDLELSSDIQSFWSGNRILQSVVKKGLKAVDKQHCYQFRAPKARDLPTQRLRFMLELIKAAGYKGWVILIDELELIGSYSILQRARSYAELARWMGRTPGEQYPGMVVVGAITEDFEAAIINEKDDRDAVVPRLLARGDDLTASRAKIGMDRIHTRSQLATLSPQVIEEAIRKIRNIYSVAYNWDAPSIIEEKSSRTAGYQQRMRYKVRAAINKWDLQRLYPGSDPDPEIDLTEYKHDYTEDHDLSSEITDDHEGNQV